MSQVTDTSQVPLQVGTPREPHRDLARKNIPLESLLCPSLGWYRPHVGIRHTLNTNLAVSLGFFAYVDSCSADFCWLFETFYQLLQTAATTTAAVSKNAMHSHSCTTSFNTRNKAICHTQWFAGHRLLLPGKMPLLIHFNVPHPDPC